jgi:ComF family protein
LICNKQIDENALFCSEDWKKLEFITDPKCKICSHPFEFSSDKNDLLCAKCLSKKPFFDQVDTIFKYNQQIKKIIGDLKYRDATFLAKKFAEMLFSKISKTLETVDLIIPIPLHKKKLRERKFNQAVLIAKNLGKICEKKILLDCLKRNKYNISQVRLTEKARTKNLQNVFFVEKKYHNILCNKTILLLDDVMTTGTTVNRCARLLKKFKAKKIIVATIAKTIKHNTT